jgi:hypothetical protein
MRVLIDSDNYLIMPRMNGRELAEPLLGATRTFQ